MAQEQLRLMAVHAHPDDESSKGAATMARYVDEGVDVLVVTCTGGERGSILNPAMDRPEVLEPTCAEIRKAEMARARRDPRRPAGVARLRRLRAARGRPAAAAAGGLLRAGAAGGGGRAAGRGDPPAVPPARRDHLRRERRLPAPGPHHDPQDLGGGVRGGRRPGPLPGRRRALAAAEALLPHAFSRARMRRCTRRCSRPAWSRRTRSGSRSGTARTPSTPRITTRVECAEWFERAGRGADRARHPDRPRPAAGSRCRSSCSAQIWPTEDYELARSLVDTELPEDDLFAGVRETNHRMTPAAARRAPPPRTGRPARSALVVILVLLVALVFLVRSMNKHLRKVPGSFSRSETRCGAPPTRRGSRLQSSAPAPAGRAWSPTGASSTSSRRSVAPRDGRVARRGGGGGSSAPGDQRRPAVPGPPPGCAAGSAARRRSPRACRR